MIAVYPYTELKYIQKRVGKRVYWRKGDEVMTGFISGFTFERNNPFRFIVVSQLESLPEFYAKFTPEELWLNENDVEMLSPTVRTPDGEEK